MAILRRLSAAALLAALAATAAGCGGAGDRGNDGGVPATAPDSAYEGRPDGPTGETNPREDNAVDLRPGRGHRVVRVRQPAHRRGPASGLRRHPPGGVRQLLRPALPAAGRRRFRHLDRRLPPAVRARAGGRPTTYGSCGSACRPATTTREARPDAALTFVVDVSGSMAEHGRLDLVQDALHTLVDQLRPTDAVAVVAFNDRAQVIREMTRVADADALHRAIDELSRRWQHQPRGRSGHRVPGRPGRLPARRAPTGWSSCPTGWPTSAAPTRTRSCGRIARGGGQADRAAGRRRGQRVRRHADGAAGRPGRRFRGVRQRAVAGPGGVRPPAARDPHRPGPRRQGAGHLRRVRRCSRTG